MDKITALDPGFGNFKICQDGDLMIIPAAVARPRPLGLAGRGLRTSRPLEIEFDGQAYAVGQQALAWGAPITSMDFSAIPSPPRRALFYGALFMGDPYTVAQTIDLLVIGLPVPLLQDKDQAQAILKGLRGWKGSHEYAVIDRHGAQNFELMIRAIKILAQPVGAYSNWLITEDLQIRRAAKNAEVAVIDIGLNTLDLFVIQAGQVAPRFLHGATCGVRRLLEALDHTGHDLEELDLELRAGRLRANPTELETWLGEILATVETTWPSLKRFDAVIPTGGGALILDKRLQSALVDRGAALHWPEDPISANVEGLWRYYARRAARRAER